MCDGTRAFEEYNGFVNSLRRITFRDQWRGIIGYGTKIDAYCIVLSYFRVINSMA